MGDAPNKDYATIESMQLLDNLYHEVLRLRSGGKRHPCPSPSKPKLTNGKQPSPHAKPLATLISAAPLFRRGPPL